MLSSGLFHHLRGCASTCMLMHTHMHARTYTHTHAHPLTHACTHAHTHFFKKNELVYVLRFDDSERSVLLLLSLASVFGELTENFQEEIILKRERANQNKPAAMTTSLLDRSSMTLRSQAAQIMDHRRLTCIGDQVLTSR